MPREVQTLSMAQEDGASSAALSAGSALGEGRMPASPAGFEDGTRLGAMNRRRSLL
jgi:hypothetical protein